MKSSKKIAILTQPLVTNYGGILQAYALQKVLEDFGHEVVTLNTTNNGHSSLKIFFLQLKQKLFKHHNNLILNKSQHKCISANSSEFIKKNIKLTDLIGKSLKIESFFGRNKFDSVIVGSDQVWRPKYSPNIYNYYFDFLKDDDKTRKITYAASFGTENWEYSEEETLRCKELVRKIDAVSVRENSGIDLCKKYLDRDVNFVLDPTLLLDKTHYAQLFSDAIPVPNKGSVYTYILDRTEEKKAIINIVCKHKNLEEEFSQPKKALIDNAHIGFQLEEFIYPPVENWIKGFYDADFVVTDSFHGVVFSLIFNKNFIAIGNTRRGLARFKSILSVFGLESRLVLNRKDLTEELLTSRIDFKKVNEIKETLKRESILFLRENV